MITSLGLAIGGLAGGMFGVARWARRRGQVQELRARLQAEDDAQGPELAHRLPQGLRRLHVQSRTLRAQLEGPLRALSLPPWAETPWGRRARCDAWDLAVGQLRRSAWDWRMGFSRLSSSEKARLSMAGLQRVPLTPLLLGGVDRSEDPWEQVLFATGPDPKAVGEALRCAAAELLHFEALVADCAETGYRAIA